MCTLMCVLKCMSLNLTLTLRRAHTAQAMLEQDQVVCGSEYQGDDVEEVACTLHYDSEATDIYSYCWPEQQALEPI